MLCSSADGTPELAEAMKIAVPGTRSALELALLAKIATGMRPSAIFARISARPRDQVVSSVKMIIPTMIGNHAPSNSLAEPDAT